MKKLIIPMVTAVILLAADCYAVNLDAPPPLAKKTIRSEIVRGNNAALACVGKGKFNECVLKAIANERASAQSNEAFELGAKTYAWSHSDIYSKSDPYEADMAKAYYRDIARMQKEMGIDDETLAPLISIKAESLLPRLKEYKQNMAKQ